jgi:hypothetical protein
VIAVTLVRRHLLAGFVLAIMAVGCSVTPYSAEAETQSTITPSFSPNRLGASTTFALTIAFTAESGEVPSPLRHAIVHLPAGLWIEMHGVGTCSKARLQAHGPRGCPASSRVGTGHATLEAQLGSQTISENASLSAFRGPNQGGHSVLEISGQGQTPLVERVLMVSVLEPDHAPYGNKLVTSIPPIPTLPGEPNASTIRFSLTVGAASGSAIRGSHPSGAITVPRSCPAAGFAFGADFSFADGSSTSATALGACP